MTARRPIHLVVGGRPPGDDLFQALCALGDVDERDVPPESWRDAGGLAPLVVLTEDARETLGRPIGEWYRESNALFLFLYRHGETIPRGLEDFDDAAPLGDAEEAARRARTLIGFAEAYERAGNLGVGPDDLRAELEKYGLDPGLVGPRGLLPPGRIAIRHLVDVDAVNRQQMSICRLMGTAYGTFLKSDRPHGLLRPDGEEIAPTGALSPYCAYLSAQGGHCLKDEYGAARRALLRGRPVTTTCGGRVAIYSAPVCLTFDGAVHPLFAASVAVGGVPAEEEIAEVCAKYGVNEEILRQMAQESRFWVLNPDKADEIRGTFRNLAETVSREVSHKYGTAWQIFRSLLTEVEIRNSRSVIAESHRMLEETNRQLHTKNEEIYEVTHAITHDLRKPLSSLKATIGLISKGNLGPVPERQREAIDTANEATGYMNQLVDDLLEAARLDAGRKVLDMRDVPLPPVVEKIRKRYAYVLAENGIALEIGPLPAVVRGDESALEKIFMNLVGNSVSYIGTGEKRIRVSGEVRDGRAVVVVEDTGIGIPDASLPHVFEKFRRGSNVAGIRGTGLGLAIVKGMVEAQGGQVIVASREGAGTTVTFTVPVGQAAAATEVASFG